MDLFAAIQRARTPASAPSQPAAPVLPGAGAVTATLAGVPGMPSLMLMMARSGARPREVVTGADGEQHTVRGVRHSRDFERIMALPRRDPSMDLPPGIDAMVRKPGAVPTPEEEADPEIPTSLRPIQRRALWEAMQCGGLVGFIGAGWGKTGIALLLPTVLASECTAILCPTQLKAQMIADAQRWGRFFNVRMDVIHFVAYEELSSANTADVLDRLNPDLVVGDEIHKLRHRSAARTKRFHRFFSRKPLTRLCTFSGTMSTNSIKDYAHILGLALKGGSPLPLHFPDVVEWAQALDPAKKNEVQLGPGVLRALCNAPDEPVLFGYRRRLLETPGVVATDDGALDTSLVLQERPVPDGVPSEVRTALARLVSSWQRPDGEELASATQVHAVGAQLTAGMFLRWVWPNGEPDDADKDWLFARAAWNKALRHRLRTHARPGGDSPMLLARQAERGEWVCPEWTVWKSVRDRYKPTPPTEVVWVSDYMVDDAVSWGRAAPGIIWYRNPAAGERIAARGGFAFVGAGKPAAEELARLAACSTPPTVVCSIKAHGTGKNLQRWSRNLLFQLPGNAADMEQLLARTHRPGQLADRVVFEVYAHTEHLTKTLDKAFAEAAWLEGSSKNRQRLLYAAQQFETYVPDPDGILRSDLDFEDA